MMWKHFFSRSPEAKWLSSQALIRQLEGVEITEPLRAKLIKQPIGDGKRCFYKLVDPDD